MNSSLACWTMASVMLLSFCFSMMASILFLIMLRWSFSTANAKIARPTSLDFTTRANCCSHTSQDSPLLEIDTTTHAGRNDQQAANVAVCLPPHFR